VSSDRLGPVTAFSCSVTQTSCRLQCVGLFPWLPLLKGCSQTALAFAGNLPTSMASSHPFVHVSTLSFGQNGFSLSDCPPLLSQTGCRLQLHPSEPPLCQANQASLCKKNGLPSLCHSNRLSPYLFSELVFLRHGHWELCRALSRGLPRALENGTDVFQEKASPPTRYLPFFSLSFADS